MALTTKPCQYVFLEKKQSHYEAVHTNSPIIIGFHITLNLKTPIDSFFHVKGPHSVKPRGEIMTRDP